MYSKYIFQFKNTNVNNKLFFFLSLEILVDSSTNSSTNSSKNIVMAHREINNDRRVGLQSLQEYKQRLPDYPKRVSHPPFLYSQNTSYTHPSSLSHCLQFFLAGVIAPLDCELFEGSYHVLLMFVRSAVPIVCRKWQVLSESPLNI